MSALQHQFRYAGHSSLGDDKAAGLRLVGASSEAAAGFFKGTLLFPRVSALCLRAISQIVLSRFYITPGVLQQIADPVVTASEHSLRFEGFSACCSTYARLDIDNEGFHADEYSPGTTNVDFQAPLRAALAKVRDGDSLAMSVNADAVTVDTPDEQIIEKKVPLPVRWIKGLGEVQAHLASMKETLRTNRAGTVQFFRALPPEGSRHRFWVVPAGKGFRLSQREMRGAVPMVSPERLRAMEPLIPLCSQLRVFTNDAGSSAWVLDLKGQSFVLVLSPERWRGFSGEGQLLSHLASKDSDEVLNKVQASLNWQEHIDPDELSATLGIKPDALRAALSVLAARGLVGYDLKRGGYFHRVLPFDLSAIEALNPRLRSARKLVDEGKIEIQRSGDDINASVPTTDVVHRVTLKEGTTSCTCPWYAKHGGERGPCKHVLAVEMLLEDEEQH